MSGRAFLFPGQASQYVGMGHDLYDAFPAARACFDRCGELLGSACPRHASKTNNVNDTKTISSSLHSNVPVG